MKRWARSMWLRAEASLLEYVHEADDQQIKYLGYRTQNWGDALNPVLIQKLSGRSAYCVDIDAMYLRWRRAHKDDQLFLVVGSTLGHADHATVVWGTGFMHAEDRPIERPRRIYAVRGPLTRRRLLELGIPCPEVFGDPALLFPRFYRPKVMPRFALGIVPHYVDWNHPLWTPLRKNPDVLFINIKGGIRQVVDQIVACRRIASTSLHGLIIADAYEVPSIWISASDRVLGGGFKFLDYFAAAGRSQTQPVELSERMLQDLHEEGPYQLGTAHDLNALYISCPFRNRT